MDRRLVLVLLLTASSVGISGYSYVLYKKWKSRKPPKHWKKLGNISELYIYPLKSGRYIQIQSAECTEVGFNVPAEEGLFQMKDRSFIIYGEKDLEGKSGRVYPTIVLISISAKDDNHVIFQAPGKDPLNVQVPAKSEKNIKTIKFQWSHEDAPTIDCGDEASQWFSQFLLQKNSGLRLGYHDSSFHRNTKSFTHGEFSKFYEYISDTSFGVYSDFSSLQLMNKKTVVDLNSRLKNKVSSTSFRPNIVIDHSDLEPFVEDKCLWIKIGNVITRNVKECVRCVFTTVDPELGTRDQSREVLNTLSEYRMSPNFDKGPMMGVHLEVIIPGTISVDDEVFTGIQD